MNFNFTRSIVGILAFLLFSVASQANNSYKLSKPKEGKPSEQFSNHAKLLEKGKFFFNPIYGRRDTVCVYASTTLSYPPIPNGTWRSLNTSIATVDINTGVVTGVKKGQTIISYSYTTPILDSILFYITVNPLPFVSPISGADSTCINNSIGLSNSTTGGYWVNQNPFIGSLSPNGLFTPMSLGTDTIRYVYQDSLGCIDSVSKVITVSTSACITCLSNISFENNNFSNWVVENGIVGPTNTQFNFTTIGPTANIHTITSASTIPKFDALVGSPVYHGGSAGKYSLLLNPNSVSNNNAASASYTFTIPANQQSFMVKYYQSIVLSNAPHNPYENPGFTRNVYDITTNQLIKGASVSYLSDNTNGLPYWTTSNNSLRYCLWTPISVTLNGLAGHTIKLEFIVFGCVFGGHIGYAYLDFDTACFVSKTNTKSDLIIGKEYCIDGSNVKITAPSGFKNYVIKDSNFLSTVVSSIGNNVLSIPTISNADTVNYNLILIPYPGFGNSDTIPFQLVGHNLPIVGPITGNDYVCRGNRTLLTDTSLGDVSATGAGIWLPYNPANITIENTSVGYTSGVPSSSQATVKIAQAGITDSVKYVVTNMYGCMGSANYTVTKPPVNTNNYNLSGCSSVALNGVSYTSSAIVNDTLLTQSGCDSLYNVTTINVIPVVAVVQNAVKDGCNTVAYNGITYSNSTYLRDTVRSMQGCDSIYHVTHILVNTPAPPTVNIVASSTTATTGTPITFVANASNVGTTVNYQFMVNHSVVQNSASDSFTTSTLVNNDTVFCIVTTTTTCGTFTSTSDTVVMNITPLPLSLLSFEGNLQGRNAHLNWLTTAEINTSHFILQRSTDGKTFKDVAKVQAQGESNKQHLYSYTDYAVTELANAPVLYYRIKMFDKDGNFSTSKTIAIKIISQSELFVYPNPVKNRLNVTIQPSKEQVGNMVITDVQGKLISEQTIKLNQGINKFEINTTNLLRGNYILIFKGTEGVRYAKFTRE